MLSQKHSLESVGPNLTYPKTYAPSTFHPRNLTQAPQEGRKKIIFFYSLELESPFCTQNKGLSKVEYLLGTGKPIKKLLSRLLFELEPKIKINIPPDQKKKKVIHPLSLKKSILRNRSCLRCFLNRFFVLFQMQQMKTFYL